MKKLIFLLSLVSLSIASYGQTYYNKNAHEIVPGAEMVVMETATNTPSFIRFNKGSEPSFQEFEIWFEKQFKSVPELGLKLLRKENDELGFTHYRYQQTYKNMPIHSNIFILHVRNNKIESMNGQFFNRIDIPVVASFTETDALTKALNYTNAERYKWQVPEEEALLKRNLNNENATYFPKGELMIAPNDNNFKGTNYSLAYRFDIFAHKPMSRKYVFVDAISGKVILTLDRIQFEDHGIQANTSATAATKYNGTRDIVTDSYNGSYRLRETTRGLGIETYNLNNGTNYGNATDFTNATTSWTGTNAAQDEVARDAHWSTEMTWDYFSIKHNRNSIDNAGFKLISYVHADLVGMGYGSNTNAFWNGNYMTYGDGSSPYTPLTTLDICGHEIAHGLTEFTANLNYSYESGALNEAFSDIFGVSIEFYAKPPFSTGNWTMGEEIGTPFRSMSNPNQYGDPDTYQGTNWYSGSLDNGGVHTNSGVLNFWYYLLCMGGTGTNDIGNAYNVTGITMAKAEKIAFRTLTVYLTPTSNYADARNASLQACADLYGGCSPENISVTNAWHAIGVGAAYTTATVHADFFACPVSLCSNAPFTVQFSNSSTSANSYIWDFGDNTTSILNNPQHTYNTNGAYNVKLIANGGVCGTDSVKKTSFITIGPSYPCQVSVPTTGTGTTPTSCTGTLYDSGLCGDYTNNTDGTITIAPSGATSVTLNFNTFDFEQNYDYLYVYNGPTTASPQVTGSPFTGNIIPGSITSIGGAITIRQTTDQGLVSSGFSLNWTCGTASSPPIAGFIADATSSCTGTINFIDQSSNLPNAWHWDFGDGQTSVLQNPSHTYYSNGNYTVKLIAYNNYGKDSIIKINNISINMPAGPSVSDTIVCTGNQGQLTASGNGVIMWYDSSYSTSPIFTGNTFTTPFLTSTRNYWVKDSIPGLISFGGKTDTIGGGSMFTSNNIHYEIFNCYTPMVLQSVKIYANTNQTSRVINLQNSSGVVLATKSVNLIQGLNTVMLNFKLPVANALRLVGPASPGWYRNTGGFTYPINLPGKLSITGSSANSTLRYYYFYDWVLLEPECVSPKIMVTVIVDSCLGIDDVSNNASINIYPNPANDVLNVDITGNSNQQLVIEIYNLQGQKVYSETDSKISERFNKSINTSDFAKGIYLIKVQVGSQISLRKVQLL